jgi:hypothetical protein
MNALRMLAWSWLCRAAAGTLPGTLRSISPRSARIPEGKELKAAVFHTFALPRIQPEID